MVLRDTVSINTLVLIASFFYITNEKVINVIGNYCYDRKHASAIFLGVLLKMNIYETCVAIVLLKSNLYQR